MDLRAIGVMVLVAVAFLALPQVAAGGPSGAVQVSGCLNILPETFTFTPVSGSAPLVVSFAVEEAPSAEVDSSFWQFGDGGTSAGPAPSHTYTLPGTYFPTLTLTGPCSQEVTITAPQPVTVSPSVPVFDFTADRTCVCRDQPVRFTGILASGTAESWTWYYRRATGPGATWMQFATGQYPPPFTITNAGTYDIRLTVVSQGVSYPLVKPAFITVISPSSHLDPDFSVDPERGSAPLRVTFTDESTGACIVSRTWENQTGRCGGWREFFLAGDSSFTFTTPGTYPVRLKVQNACGRTKTSETETIKVTCPDLRASFSVDRHSVTSGTVVFTSSVTGALTTWDLDFGDGSPHLTTPAASVPHTYYHSGPGNQPSSYRAVLTVTNGCSKVVRSKNIEVRR
jgi:PKD repeat protein